MRKPSLDEVVHDSGWRRTHVALREAIMAYRNGGTVSIAGVYGGFVDKIPMGSLMNRSLTIKTGQTHVHRYLKPLLGRIANGEIEDAPEGIPDLQRQARRVHQDRAEAVMHR